jgi:DNA-binding Lrp family transcriptional regulator
LKPRLTALQKRLCNVLQDGLPICWRPFAEIAAGLHADERDVLRQIRQLKDAGVIRRISARINHRAFGMVSTLVAAHVPPERLAPVAEAVSALAGVSHHYQRSHYYNVWFTLQAQTAEHLETTLTKLSGRFGIDFHSLPVKRAFKLNVRFDAESEGQQLLPGAKEIPKDEPVELDERQKQVLAKLQGGLELSTEPFAFLCSHGLKKDDVLRVIAELIEQGVIRRIAAVVDYRKLGFVANVLFAAEVPQSIVIQTGERLAHLAIVSHCYERQTFEGWPYNLYAMMHGQNMGQVTHAVDKFTESERIDSFELLPTAAELKKAPVKHQLD